MRRRLLVVTFVTVLLAVLVAGHVYLARRLVLDPGLSPAATKLLTAMIVLFGCTLVLQPIGERLLPRSRALLIAWPASLWMGFAFLLLTLILFSDVVLSLLGAAVASPGDVTPHLAVARARAVGALGAGLVAGFIGVRRALRGPIVRRLEILLAHWPRTLDGFRIVQISDVHIGLILDRRFAADVVARCNQLAPDLVAVTGDLVDGSIGRIAAEVEPFGELRARHGVFFVTGNHDHYSGADPWVARVQQLGMRVLRNERVTIGDGEASFELAGVEDHHAHLVGGTHREDLPGALRGRDPKRPMVLLAHDPATFHQAAGLGVDLQLSGHTHAGQVWPFRYLVRLSTPYVAGHYRVDGSQLYVSSGTGFWGPAMRIFTTAEITEIIVRPQPALAG